MTAEPLPTWDGTDTIAPLGDGVRLGHDHVDKDGLAGCTFEKSGFRAFRLSGPGWQLVLSRVDVGDRDPRGLVSVYAPGHANAFGDLGGYVLSRTVGLYGGSNLRQLADALAHRVGGPLEEWMRRLDYLAVRAMRELQLSTASVTLTGLPERPGKVEYVFDGRLRRGRTLSLFGPGSAGKTTLTDGLIASATSGLEIVPGWSPSRRFVVGLLDWDEGELEERVRLHAILAGRDAKIETRFEYLPMSRPLADAADEVGRWVVEKGIELLIVSPVNRALRAAYGDPGAPVFELYEVTREFGTTNVLLDHVTGALIDGSAPASREYGSVAKRDAARGSYSVYVQSEEPGHRVVVVRNAKPDSLAPRRPVEAVSITYSPAQPVDGCYDSILFEAASVEAPEIPSASRRESQPDKLIRLLREHGPLSATELAALGGFRADRVRFVARKARETRTPLVSCGSDDRYSIEEVAHVD